MIKSIKIALLLVCFPVVLYAQKNQGYCATMEMLEYQQSKDPFLKKRMEIIETFTRKNIKKQQKNEKQQKIAGDVYRIPVVVHILYNEESENISDAQIKSQITTTNRDFAYLRTINKWPQAANTEIEFYLAKVDPNGKETNGITRKKTDKTNWFYYFNPDKTNDIKRTSKGGVSPWNPEEYLNIWVVNLGKNLYGYAQFPGGDISTDGVVVNVKCFGNKRWNSSFDLKPTREFGKTLTHEIGHYLNLRHIWGDGDCREDDFVADTPNSDAPNYGIQKSHMSCGSLDMIENFMDYSDDEVMSIFTEGQKQRMRTVFDDGGARRKLAESDKELICGTVENYRKIVEINNKVWIEWDAPFNSYEYIIKYKSENGNEHTKTVKDGKTKAVLDQLEPGAIHEIQIGAVCRNKNEVNYNSFIYTPDNLHYTPCKTGISELNDTENQYDNNDYDDDIEYKAGHISEIMVNDDVNMMNYSNYNDQFYSNFLWNTLLTFKADAENSLYIGAENYSMDYSFAVFIDYNWDGSFTQDERVHFTPPTIFHDQYNTNYIRKEITIKLSKDLPFGEIYPMRIAYRTDSKAATGCGEFDAGEIEDYFVIISSESDYSPRESQNILNDNYLSLVKSNNLLNKKDKITLFPSQATNSINIKTNFSPMNSVFEIINTLGQVKIKGKLKYSPIIDISGLKPGIYHFILNNNKKNAKSFVKL